MFTTAQIDLTKLGKLLRENADLVKKVNFKDGEHQLLSITIGDKKQPDKNGNNICIACKPKDAPYDSKWYIGDGKLWGEKNPAPTQSPTPSPSFSTPSGGGEDNLPF